MRAHDETLRQNGVPHYDLDMNVPGLDEIDQRILDLLVEDARRSASEIGRRVHLSPAAAKRRIDRLEARGYIRGYTAIVDHAKIGGP
ncbi:MAG TPA: AsnC family transcriptional regulator, partial [Solirubrobacter sp.]|nr:AsnC family transcriptional regulator [Solirubrobacter sp.]